jgi:hypothetical protein
VFISLSTQTHERERGHLRIRGRGFLYARGRTERVFPTKLGHALVTWGSHAKDQVGKFIGLGLGLFTVRDLSSPTTKSRAAKYNALWLRYYRKQML